MSYVAILSARNEENFIMDCIDSVMSQTLSPELFIIVDDDSTDLTLEKIKFMISLYEVIEKNFAKCISLKNKRYKMRGINLALAYREAIKNIDCDYDFLFKIDADSMIPEYFVEKMINRINKDVSIGISSGVPHHLNKPDDYITDGAIIYRKKCLQDVGIPLITGFNVYMFNKAKQLGWKAKNFGIKYYEFRKSYQDKIINWYFSGLNNYLCGNTLLRVISGFFNDVKKHPYVIGFMIKLLSFLISKKTRKKPFDKEYYEYMKNNCDLRIRKITKYLYT